MPTLPKEIAPVRLIINETRFVERDSLPAAIKIYGSLISVLSEAPSTGSPETPGFKTVNCSTIHQWYTCIFQRRETKTYIHRISLRLPEREMAMLCQHIDT